MPPRKKPDRVEVSEWIATGDIQHGQEGVEHEGGALFIQAGEFLPAGVFTDEEIQRLVDLGAVAHRDEFGRHPLDAQLEQKRAELEELEARLEEREAQVAAVEKAAGELVE